MTTARERVESLLAKVLDASIGFDPEDANSWNLDTWVDKVALVDALARPEVVRDLAELAGMKVAPADARKSQ